MGVVRKNKKSSLSDLLHQAILMMQAAKQRRLHNTVTGGQLVSVVAGRNTVLVGLRNSPPPCAYEHGDFWAQILLATMADLTYSLIRDSPFPVLSV